ncbi:MAG TPA: TonB-dependent receptor [Lacunisphaera sp.]
MSRAAADDDSGAAVKKLKQLSIEDLMEIEVTSVSKRPEKLIETPSAIQVITDEDISRSGATSIPEALRLAGNLDVAQQNSHDWNITARGFNTDLGNKLLVLIDGRTVYTPLFSGVFWDAQDYLMEDLDRIEVISGPGGTLWGANAVNGVINITTKSAKDTQGTYLDSIVGSDLKDSFGARYGGVIAPGVYFRVYGKYFERDDGKLADGTDATNAWRMGQGGFRIDSETHPGTVLTFQGDLYSGVEDLETGGSSDVSGGNLLGRWTQTTSVDESTSLQIYYDRTHLTEPKPASNFAAAGVLKDDLDTWDLDFQHRARWGERNQLVSGLGYRFTHDVVQNTPTVAFLPARLNRSLFSGFVQDEIKLREDVFLTLGAKLEHNDYTGFETEPNVRLQWNVTSKQMVWSAISRAVRTPSRIDRDLTEPTGLPAPFPESILNGGSDFESETVIAYEVGYRAQLGAKAVVSVATFYNDYDHIRSTTPGVAGFPTFGFPLTFENNLEGETHGVEFNGTYQLLDNWRLQGSYNFLKESLHVKPGTVDFSNALNETADPQNQFSLRSSLDLPHEVAFDTGLRWVDTLHNNDGPTPGTVPSYFELDVRIAWHPTRQIELSLVGQNLLHDHHPEYGFPSTTREEVGRNIYAKVAWRY